MIKSILQATILIVIIFLLTLKLYNTKNELNIILQTDNSLDRLHVANNDFNSYINSTFNYTNFDQIEAKVKDVYLNLEKLKKLLDTSKLDNPKLYTNLSFLEKSFEAKISSTEKIGSYKAILNNSYRFLSKAIIKINSNEYYKLYILLNQIYKTDQNTLENIKDQITTIDPESKLESYFLKHSQTIIEYYFKYNQLVKNTSNLNTEFLLDTFENQMDETIQSYITSVQNTISIFLIFLIIFIVLYVNYSHKIIKSNQKLNSFKTGIESSDNIIIVTDEKQRIKYVNESFTKSTGYTLDDVQGKTPSVLKSDHQSAEFYKQLNDTIRSGEKWFGEIINYDKNNNIRYYKSSIVPIYENNKIIEYIAIKLDITDDILKTKQLYEKDQILAQQSKMAAMGEMLENIAHQWRQPLSAISTTATGVSLQLELGLDINNQTLIDSFGKINDSAQYLSQTINSFRNYFKTDNEKQLFNLKDSCVQALNIISSKIQNSDIQTILEFDDVQCYGLETEFIQVFMNLINNAIDAFENKNIEKFIFITIKKNSKYGILEVKDNAGGVPQELLTKVFEPYFTTKHKSQGTGIGLYMSREMIVKHMGGILEVINTTYNYNNTTYTGAVFCVYLPLNNEN
ncbi:MAG: PAS domain-containing sensor histidine kinase [Campylobacterales bacterium]|nr:PAS domain-containing sensor histidine kinase [Campylobacterales bacterium]